MESDQTLHSFVLSMLTDQSALTSFVTNPEGALNAAGLGDISAADVHDVIPMVIDYAPAGAVSGLESAFSSLPIDSIEAGQAGAIQQLQAVAESVTSTVAGGLGGHFQAGGAGFELAGAAAGGLDGLTGAVAATGPHSALAASLAGGLDGVAGSVTASVAGHELGGAIAGGLDGLTVSYESPLGDNSVHGGITSTLPIPSMGSAGDLAYTLDSTVSTAASTVVSDAAATTGVLSDPQVSVESLANGSAVNALTGQVEAIAGTVSPAGLPISLPALPALPALPVASSLPTLSGASAATTTATSAVHEVTSVAHSGISQVTGVLSQVPGAAPVTAQLHDVTHEVNHLVSGVVSDLPAQLPVGDPFTATGGAAHAGGAEATGAVSQSPVTDLAGASAVTGVVDQVHSDVSGLTHGLLPDVHLPL
jgi:hypothetical protein